MNKNSNWFGEGRPHPMSSLFETGASELGSEAFGYALMKEIPFKIDELKPVVSEDEEDGSWKWAVFSNRHPYKSLAATKRDLSKAVRAARRRDRSKYVAEWLISKAGLKGKSGQWPRAGGSRDFNVNYVDDEYGVLYHVYRLLLCSPHDVIGFCAVTISSAYSEVDHEPDLTVEIDAAFIDIRYREENFFSMLAEGAAFVAVEFFREIHDRLNVLQVRHTFDVEVRVEGEINSPEDEDFLGKVGYWIENLVRMEPLARDSASAGLWIREANIYGEYSADLSENDTD
jgi:hypothetical protein